MKLLCRRCVLDDLMYRPVLLPPRRDYEYPLLNRRVRTSPGSRERGSTAGGGELSNRKCRARAPKTGQLVVDAGQASPGIRERGSTAGEER